MIVYWMQQTLEGLERQPLEAEDEAYVQAPLPMPLYQVSCLHSLPRGAGCTVLLYWQDYYPGFVTRVQASLPLP